MTVSREIVKRVESIGIDRVFSIADLKFPEERWDNVRIKLSRMVKDGKLMKVAKGKFYRPHTSILGPVPLSSDALVMDLLYSNGKVVGYYTDYSIWDSMGLTTQFSSTIVIGLNRRKDPIVRDGRNIRFVFQPNEINERNVKLLQLLDTIKLIKKIPDTTRNESVRRLLDIVRPLDEDSLIYLVDLAMKYPPRVRVLAGALIDSIGYYDIAYKLKDTLNPLTEYKLGIDKSILSTTINWRIV